jgi:hypothetical protein
VAARSHLQEAVLDALQVVQLLAVLGGPRTQQTLDAAAVHLLALLPLPLHGLHLDTKHTPISFLFERATPKNNKTGARGAEAPNLEDSVGAATEWKMLAFSSVFSLALGSRLFTLLGVGYCQLVA